MHPFTFTKEELQEAIEKFTKAEIREKYKKISEDIRSNTGLDKVVESILSFCNKKV